ncbi:MAG: hypothetical protein AAFP81_14025 [Pseudomonadota bacterium]
MWSFLRSISDTLGVGFLAMQLIKLIGMVFSLVGPLKFVSGLFAGIFPIIASFFKINFGLTVNGLDVMAVAIALSGTLIVWSSVARDEAMGTRYIFRFFMIPYAFLVIIFAIVVQVTTPIVEINQFNGQCKEDVPDASFYGSTCEEMKPQLAFWNDGFGDDSINDEFSEIPATISELERISEDAFEDPAAAQQLLEDLRAEDILNDAGSDGIVFEQDDLFSDDEDDLTGLSFILALLYLVLLLPLISVVVFFFKRLSVNKLLKRVLIAGGSAGGLALASAAYAVTFGG